jgi:hypothetical protein
MIITNKKLNALLIAQLGLVLVDQKVAHLFYMPKNLCSDYGINTSFGCLGILNLVLVLFIILTHALFLLLCMAEKNVWFTCLSPLAMYLVIIFMISQSSGAFQ